MFGLSQTSSVLPGLLLTCPSEPPLSQDSKVGKGVLQRFHPPAGWCPSIPSDDFHPDEGEDEQMFGLPDLPPELLEDEDDAEFGFIPFTQIELDDDGLLLERDVMDNSTHPKNVLVIVHSNGVHHQIGRDTSELQSP